ncbi:MAG: membrane dipeptidase [Sphaerochaetaceae bacterium]
MKVFDLHGHQEGLLKASGTNGLPQDVPLGDFYKHGIDASVVCAVGDPNSFGLGTNSFSMVEQQLEQILEKSNAQSLKVATTTNELNLVWDSGKTAIFLGVEGGDFIDNLEMVDRLYNLGVRVLAPVHYSDNQFGSIGFHLDGSGPKLATGLSKFGAELITHAQDIGMVIDIAHGSDAMIIDACKIAKKPLLCSHGGLRMSYGSKRFMGDEAAHHFRDNGGLLGIWPCRFGKVGLANQEELVDIILQTIDFLSWGQVGYCTDVNGAPGYLDDYRGLEDTKGLISELAAKSFTEDKLEQYCNSNIIRLFQAWGV